MVLLIAVVSGTASAQDTDSSDAPLRVTLLGTGNPRPSIDRFGPSILVEAGETTVLVDVGRGATQRLFQIGRAAKLREVDLVLFTHLHSDHVVGFSDLWLTSWVFGRTVPLRVIGPPGTDDMCRHLESAFTFNRRVRSQDERFSEPGVQLEVSDVEPSVVFEDGDLRVTAFAVDHGGNIEPAYGYRIDYAGRSVAFSGDTRYYEPIVEHARGVDVLIHEVISPEVEFRAAQIVGEHAVQQVLSHHASPEQVGEIFSRVKPRLAVYSHIVPSPSQPEDLVPPTRKTYQGPLAVGYDLMMISIGESIDVHPRRTLADE
jgi:ribonuclease Z